MATTKIEWAEKVWNPITGCTKISPGCRNCYAERMAKRLAGRCGYPQDDPFRVTLHPERLEDPIKWKNPSRIFICSMSDLFHDDVPDKFIIDVLSIIAEAHQHIFMILTKRPERMFDILTHQTVANDVWLQTTRGVNDEKSPWPLQNLWLGVTAENQEQADKRIPILLQIPAVSRFISVEPMLGKVDLIKACDVVIQIGDDIAIPAVEGINKFLHWVICGGESGPGARPMHPDWVRNLRDQCQNAGVPFLFKQWGEYIPCIPNNGTEPYKTVLNCVGVRGNNAVTMSDGLVMERVGKKKAGRMLDGKSWDEYPE